MKSTDPLTVRCPACQTPLTVAAQQAGQRIRCHACNHALLVPAAATDAGAASNSDDDDDDWLNLDSPAAPAPPVAASPAAGRTAPATGRTAPPPANSAPPAGRDAPPISDKDLELLLQYTDRSADRTSALDPPVSAPPAADDSFRVTCNTCGSLLYAKRTQVGERIRCPDCHSRVLVPQPPKPKPVFRPAIDEAESYRFQGGDQPLAPRPADPFVKSAAELLAKAEAAEAAAEEEQQWELPEFNGWFQRLAIVFRDPVLLLHMLFLSLLAFAPLALVIALDHPVMMPLGFAVALLVFSLVLANAFAVLQAVANGQDKVEEWPTFDPMAWLGNLLLAVAAIAIAAGPVFGIAQLLFAAGPLTIALAMLSLYVLFPIVLLSMLDEGSVFVPFSADVTKSIALVPGQWGAAYFSSGGLFLLLFFLYLVSGVCPPLVAAGLLVGGLVIGTFVYFAILGRLGYGIGEELNAAPMDNDIERIRERERRERVE